MFFRFKIFFRWVNIIKIKKIKSIFESGIFDEEIKASDEKKIYLVKFTIKTFSDANIDDNDEYLNIKDNTNHEKINNKLS